MAEIVGAVCLSHSPFWDPAQDDPQGPGSAFSGAVRALRDTVRRQAVDVVVVFGPDHFRNFFYDLMPAFCIGMETAHTFGEFGGRKQTWAVHQGLARAIQAGAMQEGFDPAMSYRMGVDHGLAQPFEALFPEGGPVTVPIMVNAIAGPRPSVARCLQFGAAVGRAIRAFAGAERVLLLGSGGMSHWVPGMSLDGDALEPALRAYLIDGRASAEENSARRDASLATRRAQGTVNGRVNADWDRLVLRQFNAGAAGELLAASDAQIEERGGNGAHELRNWVAVLGAWGGPLETLAYEAMPSWVTGMGCVASFKQ